MPSPEQLAREQIDALLAAAGWIVQDRDHLDRTAALGVAVDAAVDDGSRRCMRGGLA